MYELFLADKGDQGVTQNEASVKVTPPGLGRTFLCRQLSEPDQKAVKYRDIASRMRRHRIRTSDGTAKHDKINNKIWSRINMKHSIMKLYRKVLNMDFFSLSFSYDISYANLRYNFHSKFEVWLSTYPCSIGPAKSIKLWPKRKRLFNISGRHVTLTRAQMIDALVSCPSFALRSLETSESIFCGLNCSELALLLEYFLK